MDFDVFLVVQPVEVVCESADGIWTSGCRVRGGGNEMQSRSREESCQLDDQVGQAAQGLSESLRPFVVARLHQSQVVVSRCYDQCTDMDVSSREFLQ